MNKLNQDITFMQRAIELARKAQHNNEVPVGAVVVFDNKIIGVGQNRSIELNDPTAHAEILALRDAAKNIKNYRLIDTTLYVTLEPCIMCVGAMIQARIKRLVFGAQDPKAGAIESVYSINSDRKLNHEFDVTSGILAEESSLLLKDFFKSKR